MIEKLSELKTITYKGNDYGYNEKTNNYCILIENEYTTEIPSEYEEDFLFIRTYFQVIWKYLTGDD